jgi:hypothetical protein
VDTVNYCYSIGFYGTEQLARYFVSNRDDQIQRHISKAVAGAISGNVGTFEFFIEVAMSRGLTLDAQFLLDVALRRGNRIMAELISTVLEVDRRSSGTLDRDERFVAAAACGSITLLVAIISARQDVNCVAEVSCEFFSGPGTALSRASDPATIRFLLDAKADVDPRDSDTVLRGACEKLRPDAVKVLLDAGADVNLMGIYGDASFPLYYAVYAECTEECAGDKTETVNLLLSAGAKTRDLAGSKTILHLLDEYDQPSCPIDAAFATVLAHDPALVHCRDASGATPLLHALHMSKDPALVKVLLDAKADVNVVDNEGDTALL